ncbi:DUF2382 domain-containing protein [Anabaena sp. PCC 7108]|uniref:DUF2382 domain-containing protein n=1 Tax=Anabaena sp. PCC 7108 TaxID=163908 RepID=UPI00034C09C7|nr:DUF2382 domain-containing protein [Anabaena sp. PCC 7108]
MALYKLQEFDPNYRDTLEGKDIKGFGVYSQGTNEKIGSVNDILVDDEGHFRYLVIDLGLWIFGKKVLLPIGRTRIEYNTNRVYAIALTREQADNLPEFNERLVADYDYEERVRGIYRNPQYVTTPLETSSPLESSVPVDSSTTSAPRTTSAYDRDTYSYEHEPDLFNLNEQDHQTLKLYEERLIANKNRRKMGEVTVGKHVETEKTRVSVPIDREHVVIERVTPDDAGRTVSSREADFHEGEVARMEIYEETPEIRKEAFVREEVRVKKVIEHDQVETQETVRREELDVSSPNLPIEER